jgi:D-aminoacyl-tRNA deacylase
MKALLQRVSQASVCVDGQCIGAIQSGILLFLGIEKIDTILSVEKLARKVLSFRIFSDTNGKMNLSVTDCQASLLVVSQFTLVAETEKGSRPGFSLAASPEHAEALYLSFIQVLKKSGLNVQTGQFGADMQVHLVNDGPVTFLLSAS